ncbi:hypothetical protein HDF14_003931 [Edaphobacter lichenicola]|uniref:Uncharacterized protein n=1 Tax=Tunturiibacter gelidiferens TaxID=3069689 RepID=A0A9X0QHH9_9BACT|nr:hypothetical protein [Edaphobacter lichenicola]
MILFWKRCSLPTLAAIALVTVLGINSKVFASSSNGQNGESSNYTRENIAAVPCNVLVTRNDRVRPAGEVLSL